METKNLICNTKNITYNKGYITLHLELNELPCTHILRDHTFVKKSSFHVSLLCVKNILSRHKSLERMILELFCEFIKEKEVSFDAFTGELRLIHDDERRRKSIVVMCNIFWLDECINHISTKLNIKISAQPAHVTLYTLGKDLGIGVNSFTDLNNCSEIIIDSKLLELVKIQK